MGYLSHRACEVSGKCILSEGGAISEILYERTGGAQSPAWTVDAIHQAWSQIVDRKGLQEIGDPYDGVAGFTVTPRAYQPT